VGKDLDDAVGFQLAIGPAVKCTVKQANWPKSVTMKSLRLLGPSSEGIKSKTA
jgi:hypothetical protein